MNSAKEAKSVAKAQKKTQKANKKQLQQAEKNGKNAKSSVANGSKDINYGVNKLTGKTNKIPTTQIAINNNNNNNTQSNNNNIAQRLKDHYEAEKKAASAVNGTTSSLPPRAIISDYDNAPKFERSNSFSLRNKLSKLINSITSSKENLTKTDDDGLGPTKFTRSRSMILLRRTNRRSLIEPQLEQLSEEAEKSSDPTSPASPRKNSLEPTEHILNITDTSANAQVTDKTPQRDDNRPLHASTPYEEVELRRKPSLVSLTPSEGYNPQLNFQKRRSNTLISSFKSTFAGLTSEKKKPEKCNPRWSASLQSLQAIDNMVSYENMSFIDYDKFNGYEKQLEKRLSTISLMGNDADISQQSSNAVAATPLLPLPTSPSYTNLNISIPTPQTVVRRRKTSATQKLSRHNSDCRNSNFDTANYEHNLDKLRKVYRFSLDSRKLELLNDMSRKSFIFDESSKHIVDVLNLEVGSLDKSKHIRKTKQVGADAVDSNGVIKLKSKSLTHLDGLESMIACHQGTEAGKSNVSSSEYFSVSFYNDQGCQDEEFIPATKGVTLSAALTQTLRRRNLSFSQIAITDNTQSSNFLEAEKPIFYAGSSPFLSSLDENTEVENLAGRHLIITERDGSRKMLQKAASFGARTRPPRLLSSASTEETTDNSQPGKQIKQRWSGLFGSKNQQQSQLCELLNNYAKNGVPQKSAALNFDHAHFDEALEYLDNMHKSWRDFVDSEAMSEIETRIQTAIWELVTTEVYYIHALQTVTDLFLACLEAVQEERLLTDVDQNRLFSNVRDICEANLKFWTMYLYPMVAHSVTTRSPLSIAFFHQGFVTFASIFAPYKKYCAEQSTCQFYCKELNHTNALFTSYLAWCESQKMCNRLRLADILVRPMQRLTKYSLLLTAIKKNMSDVNEIEALDTMIHTVENFVFSVNNHLTTRQESERLKGVMARIESYDVVDTNNEQLEKMIKQYSQMFDLCAPMKGCPAHQVRHLFMEGDHKFKDNLGKADVHCFLLTDMLLVCKTIAKKGLGTLKMIRQPYLTDRLVVQHSNNILNCVYLNEFQVAVTAFTLQCSEAKNWHDSIYRAKTIYTRLKQGANNWDSFRFGGSGASGGTADSLGVKKSPINSSICSHVSSANNSHSGSVEWNDSRNISVDFEKTNSLSSDEGSSLLGLHGFPLKGKNVLASPHKLKTPTSSANTLSVQPINSLGQSLPNLNLHHSQINVKRSYSNNTLLVPGTTTSHSGILLLSPSHRGISYPPPSPTRVPLRRGMAFSTSTKNPPLVKTRNITSQNSINWHQIPATPTPLSPQYQTATNNTKVTNSFGGLSPTTIQSTHIPALSNESIILESPEHQLQQQQTTPPKQLSNSSLTENSSQLVQTSNETDV
ncbi:uncharacterized protein LOC119672089 isoform X2 [Teleopsis dalmanni]|uniref:uncharacterized protein LOC119672089 isoform X2 n=1 Tax=Teleopsis dalmanni TaxID=139649 RepID=UPI0018CE12AF|nr:uncharacterized protein LOC119672089 isoform X2 [Teleopsis dalmanni]